MHELGRIAVNGTESGCRQDDGYPMFAAEKVEQTAENGPAEHYFLGQWGKNANGHVTQRLVHHAREQQL